MLELEHQVGLVNNQHLKVVKLRLYQGKVRWRGDQDVCFVAKIFLQLLLEMFGVVFLISIILQLQRCSLHIYLESKLAELLHQNLNELERLLNELNGRLQDHYLQLVGVGRLRCHLLTYHLNCWNRIRWFYRNNFRCSFHDNKQI